MSRMPNMLLLGATLSIVLPGDAVAAPSDRPVATAPPWLRGEAGSLRFARAYGDHMVLAAAPKQAQVWGFAPAGAAVTVTLTAAATAQVLHEGKATADADGMWKHLLTPTKAGSAAHATSSRSCACRRMPTPGITAQPSDARDASRPSKSKRPTLRARTVSPKYYLVSL